ncbi:PilZ domain-containing protein [Enterocloster sp. OA13]|uniref:PilZ domain-containing protein n=1 Tax=Enterocloster sp. OA13 TaxID=2914161 RepID=UPI000471DA59|nr:PilZ domain-containing protein [Enterocloster sp. OA13]
MVLKDCSRCMVYNQKGQRLSEARVVHVKDSVSLFFSDYKFQDSRFQARVDFFDDQCGLIVTKCEVIIRRNPAYMETGEPWTADCRILDVKNVVQRQRDIRAKVYLEVEFELGNGRHFYGTIRNLSAGGLYITTVQSLKKGEVISFPYCFRTLERRFHVCILWVKRVEGGRYGYGCRFIKLTDGAEAAIRSFVYKKLLEKRKDLT